MEVYVLYFEGVYEERLEGIYSTLEKAEEARRGQWLPDYYLIYRWRVDSTDDLNTAERVSPEFR
jgi:hypothetical protein